MNEETLNKLRQIHARGANPSREQFGELIEIAERTTSPVQVEELSTHEVIGKIIDQMSQLQMLWGLNEPGALVRFREVSDVLFAASRACKASVAAAAPHVQAPAAPVAEPQTMRGDVADPAPIYKNHVDGKVTLINTDKMPSYATQPQPVAEQGELKELRDKWKIVDGDMREDGGPITHHLTAFMEGLNYARAAIAASQQAAEPVAEGYVLALQTVVEVPNHRPELGYTLMNGVGIFATEQEVHAAIKDLSLPLGWVSMKVSQLLPGWMLPAAPVIQQPQDERAAFEKGAE